MSSLRRSARVIGPAEIRGLIGPDEAIEAVRGGLIAHARGRVNNPAPWHLDLPETLGEVHVKGAHIKAAPYFTVKISTGFYGNAERGLPSSSGMVAVFDAEAGQPVALLLDGGHLTELRTAAAGALAADCLARTDIDTMAVIGAGGQARYQLEALLRVRKPSRLIVASRTPQRAAKFATWAQALHDWDVQLAPSIRDAVAAADLIVTTTPSTSPVIQGEWLREGAHVTAVGSDSPAKRELDRTVLQRAACLAVDDLRQSRALGELKNLDDTTIRGLPVVLLGKILAGEAVGRTHPGAITIADLTGLGVQDAAVAQHVVEMIEHE